MAKCPVCQTENAADFGLVNCTSCGSPFFVEIDGSASAAMATPPAIAEARPTIEADFGGDLLVAPELPETLEVPAPLEMAIPPEAPAGPGVPATPIEDLRSIADYGNSEESLAREGAYKFTLHVSGIDTAEIKQEVKYALGDSRFLWDIDALLATVKEGELTLVDVSAVKAALAVQRLKLLPVDIKWEQHAIHQSH
jgi:hypothetical protein